MISPGQDKHHLPDLSTHVSEASAGSGRHGLAGAAQPHQVDPRTKGAEILKVVIPIASHT